MDLFSDDMRRNPYPAYDRMQSASPVSHLRPFDLWMIFDFEGVKRGLVDYDAFSSDLSHAPGNGNPGEWFIFFDPPRHTKLRPSSPRPSPRGLSRTLSLASASSRASC